MKPNELLFTVSGSPDFDLSTDQVSDFIKVCFQYGWSLQPLLSTLPSSATYTVEVSNDGIKFDVYNTKAEDVNVDDSVCDTHFNFTHIRISTVSNGASGICNFKLVLKNG